MKILVVSPGRLPMPAVSGGAVEHLIQLLLDYNEKLPQGEFYVLGIENENAKKQSQTYQHTHFYFTKRSKLEKYVSDRHLIPYRMLDIIYILKSLPLLKKLAKDMDVILIENELANGVIMQHFIKGNYMYHAHNDTLSVHHSRDRLFLQSCSRVLTISHYLGTVWKQKAELSNVEVVFNGIDTAFFQKHSPSKRQQLREKYGIAEEEIVVVFAGRIVPEKGIRVLLEAFEHLRENTDIRLLIMGASFFEDSRENAFVREVKQLGKAQKDKIIFTGYVSYADMPDYYSIADIGCVPSLWEEPFGLTLIEQMAMELPVITTDAGAIPEIFQASCGFLFARDADLSRRIADAVLTLSTNAQLRIQMGKAGRKRVEETFSQQQFCENLLEKIRWRNQ